MATQAIPPCPESLLEKLRQPVIKHEYQDVPAEPGTVWEAFSPTGEILLFVLAECVEDAAPGVPLVFRGVPVSEFVNLAAKGDVVCAAGTPLQLLVAHVWLEGPILPAALHRSWGRLSEADWQKLQPLRHSTMGWVAESFVEAFRESLFEQFDPVYRHAWDALPMS